MNRRSHKLCWIMTALLAVALDAPRSVRAQGEPPNTAAMVGKVVPTVVSMTVRKEQPAAPARAGVATATSQPAKPSPDSDVKSFVASGFIIDPSGLIVTNYHVVDNAVRIIVTLSDGSQMPGKTVSADYFADIALVKIDPPHPLSAAHWGDSQKLAVGDQVFAAGNPFGLGLSLSAGIISALNRNIHNSPYDDFIQTDAAINHGNSGGPLFTMNGDVVGVDSDIISPTPGSVGVGFALPSNMARLVIDRLLKYGWVRPSWIGVKVQQITPEMAEAMGLQQPEGSIVAYIQPGSPADKAGLAIGDIIEGIDKAQPGDERALLRDIAQTESGQTITMTVLRNNQSREIKVVTELWPKADWEKRDTPLTVVKPNLGVPADLGLGLSPVPDSDRTSLGLTGDQTGVLISSVQPDSDPARNGVVKGDVIERVEDKLVTTPDDFMSALTAARATGRKFAMMLILPTVRENAGPRWFALLVQPVRK